MIKNITKKLADYFFARDIHVAHIRYENKVRETISDDKQLSYVLEGCKPVKAVYILGGSAIPNLLECIGLGLSIYNNDLGFVAVSGVIAEAFRAGIRRSSRKNLEFYNEMMDGLGGIQESADRTCESIRTLSDRLDEENTKGEEWKSNP